MNYYVGQGVSGAFEHSMFHIREIYGLYGPYTVMLNNGIIQSINFQYTQLAEIICNTVKLQMCCEPRESVLNDKVS